MRCNDVEIAIVNSDTGEVLNSRSFPIDLANPQRCLNYFKSTLYRLSIKDFEEPIIFQCTITPRIYAKQSRELDLF